MANKSDSKLDGKEARKLALDVLTGKAFCSDQVTDVNMIGSIFLPFLLMSDEQRSQLEVAMLLSYYEDACPMGINGYPVFRTARVFNKSDAKLIRYYLNKLQDKLDNLINEPVDPIDSSSIDVSVKDAVKSLF